MEESAGSVAGWLRGRSGVEVLSCVCQTNPADFIALAVRAHDEDLVAQDEGFTYDSVSMIDSIFDSFPAGDV